MKKTCGALVIGLLITTNVYAVKKQESICKDKLVQGMLMMIHGSNIGKKDWKPSEANCQAIYNYVSKVSDLAYDLGYNNGLKAMSVNDFSGRSVGCRQDCSSVEAELDSCRKNLEEETYQARRRGFIEGQTR